MFVHDFKQLNIFHVLAMTGSFTKTASEVKLSQAAVSYAIKNLEIALECDLFHRSTKKVSLTHEGELLLKHVMSIQQRLALAEEEIKNVKKKSASNKKLRVGASVATSIYFVEKVWPELKSEYPDIELELKPGDTSDLIDLLRNGTINFLIGVNVKQQNLSKSYIFHELFQDEKVLAFHPDHSWAKKNVITESDLSKQTVITGTRHEPTKKAIGDYLSSLAEPVSHLIEASSLSLQREMLKMNMGVGVISPFMYRDELEAANLLSVEIPGKSIVRAWGVIVRCDYELSTIEQEMVKLLIKHTKSFRGSLAGQV